MKHILILLLIFTATIVGCKSDENRELISKEFQIELLDDRIENREEYLRNLNDQITILKNNITRDSLFIEERTIRDTIYITEDSSSTSENLKTANEALRFVALTKEILW